MKKDINLNLYRVFYFVAITKSFKQASIELCVSQPAISKQIKNLEEILDVKLFYRHSKGIELTNEGNLLLSQVEKMDFYLSAVDKYIDSYKDLSIGNLTIGCPSHITSFYLLDYIESFKKDYPNINIKIVSDSTDILVDSLSHHKLDFIIDCFPININSKEMIIKSLKCFETLFVCSKDYNHKIKNIADLNKENFILPLPRSSMRKNLEQDLYKLDIKLNCNLSVETTDLIISSVKRNFGIGYVIKDAIKKDLEKGILKKIDLEIELPKLYLNLVYIEDYLSYAAIKFLKEYIKVK